jgi:hypothetical protein
MFCFGRMISSDDFGVCTFPLDGLVRVGVERAGGICSNFDRLAVCADDVADGAGAVVTCVGFGMTAEGIMK